MRRAFKIEVIGSGFVGQATGKGFLGHGHKVTFVDVDEKKLRRLQREGLQAVTPAEAARRDTQPDISILTVNTPTRAGAINLVYLRQAVEQLGQRMRRWSQYHVVVVRSTVVPGTTEELVQLIERTAGKKAGVDFGVCMNPEFLREKTAQRDFAQPWLVVIGEWDQRSGDWLAEVYSDFGCPIQRVSIREAEFQKYVHNIFNAVKITFFNEMRQVARSAQIPTERIFPLVAQSAEGMWNPEYGIRDKGPFDGSCLPKDTQAFLQWAAEQGWRLPLLAAAIQVNEELAAEQAAAMATQPVAAGVPSVAL